MPVISESSSRNFPRGDGQSSNFPPTYSNDDRASFDSAYHGNTSNTNGGRRRGAATQGYSSRDSGSDFYSEDDSDNSEDYTDGAGHLLSATRRSDPSARRGNGREDFLRGVDGHDPVSSPMAQRSNARNGINSGGGVAAGVNRMSTSDVPLSYFHRHNTNAFSLPNEFRCYVGHLRHLFRTVEEDRLPWKTDFADLHKMCFPCKMKELAGRINLNIPYYSSNYIEVFYVVTMPFLFLYNTPFFLVTFVTMVLIHSIALRRKNTQVYGESVTVLGRPISYRNLAHIILFAFAMLFMFFNGLETLLWTIALNVCIIVPHAAIRKPTYFNDEDMEKCRPKLGQYGIVLLLLALDYLEGDVRDDDETMSRLLVEAEKKRLASVLEKREGKD